MPVYCERPGDCAYPGCDCEDDSDPFDEDDDDDTTNGRRTMYAMKLARQLAEARALLSHPQWEIVARALDRFSAGEISDLHALGIIGQGFLVLDRARALLSGETPCTP